MKRLAQFGFTAILLISITSCKVVKDKEPVDNGSTPVEVSRTVGTVRMTDDCGFYIDVFIGDVAHSYFPTNLDAKFQVDGMRLKFAYKVAAIKPPVNCPNFEPVTLNDVTPIR